MEASADPTWERQGRGLQGEVHSRPAPSKGAHGSLCRSNREKQGRRWAFEASADPTYRSKAPLGASLLSFSVAASAASGRKNESVAKEGAPSTEHTHRRKKTLPHGGVSHRGGKKEMCPMPYHRSLNARPRMRAPSAQASLLKSISAKGRVPVADTARADLMRARVGSWTESSTRSRGSKPKSTK